MSSTQRGTTRRRSARLAFDDDDAPPAGKRAKTEATGSKSAAKTNGAVEKKKSKAASYDENDDGFTFARGKARKAKAAQAPQPRTIPEEPSESITPAAPPARRKKDTTAAAASTTDAEPAKRTRRSARLSGDHEQDRQSVEPIPAKSSKRVKHTPVRQTIARAPEGPAPGSPGAGTYDEDHVEFVGAQEPQQLHVAKKRSGAKTIPLPFADTPVIKRNKEMRKGSGNGQRRSSAGLRGRRSSALIESGQSTAVPHAQVDASDFYKHIDQSLPEPRRMKHLLTWCASRAMLEKPSGDNKDHNAIMAARQIQQELLDDFANKPAMSDWFDREDAAPTAIPKKPNPRNVQISERLKELEVEIESLQREERAWKSLTKLSATLPSLNPNSQQPPSSNPTEQQATADRPLPTSKPSSTAINPTLLDSPTQSSILQSLSATAPHAPPNTSPHTLTTHISTLTSTLEPTIDTLASGIHTLTQYRASAERVADRILADVSARVEARSAGVKEQAGTGGVGVGDVLRGLGGILGERR